MDNQHKLITGYRDLTQAEVDLMNAIKAFGVKLQEITDEMKKDKELDQRWVSIGVTHLQQGLMALVRSVAQPTSF